MKIQFDYKVLAPRKAREYEYSNFILAYLYRGRVELCRNWESNLKQSPASVEE